MIIAIIDDQDEIRFSVSKILGKENHRIIALNGSEMDILTTLQTNNVELLILDVMLETDYTGIDLLKIFRQAHFDIPVILMTAFTTPENLIDASKLHVDDVLQKPFEKKELLATIAKYQDNHENIDNKTIHPLTNGSKTFVGSYETMKEVYKQIGMCSNNDFTVLIRGETGTGKELIAHLVHTNSNQKNAPFIAVNCASIPAELFESHFFGHEKGSFTSADKQHMGYAEQVGAGTLFLDEIGELDITLQSKLLRFLENKTFRRVGGTVDMQFKGRILSATNKDLQEQILENKFREDLFFRLSMATIALPSLSERKGDIPLLVEHFIERANHDLGTSVKAISEQTLLFLSQKTWAGNIRELRNTIYNACLSAKQNVILPKDIVSSTLGSKPKNMESVLKEVMQRHLAQKGIEHLYDIHEFLEKTFYEVAIDQCSNITKLADYLKTSRLTLRKTLQKFDISYKKD